MFFKKNILYIVKKINIYIYIYKNHKNRYRYVKLKYKFYLKSFVIYFKKLT